MPGKVRATRERSGSSPSRSDEQEHDVKQADSNEELAALFRRIPEVMEDPRFCKILTRHDLDTKGKTKKLVKTPETYTNFVPLVGPALTGFRKSAKANNRKKGHKSISEDADAKHGNNPFAEILANNLSQHYGLKTRKNQVATAVGSLSGLLAGFDLGLGQLLSEGMSGLVGLGVETGANTAVDTANQTAGEKLYAERDEKDTKTVAVGRKEKGILGQANDKLFGGDGMEQVTSKNPYFCRALLEYLADADHDFEKEEFLDLGLPCNLDRGRMTELEELRITLKTELGADAKIDYLTKTRTEDDRERKRQDQAREKSNPNSWWSRLNPFKKKEDQYTSLRDAQRDPNPDFLRRLLVNESMMPKNDKDVKKVEDYRAHRAQKLRDKAPHTTLLQANYASSEDDGLRDAKTPTLQQGLMRELDAKVHNDPTMMALAELLPEAPESLDRVLNPYAKLHE